MNSIGRVLKRVTWLAGHPRSSRKLTTGSLAVVGAFTLGMSTACSQPPQPRPLAANDVSILFPAPRNAKDLTNLIAMSTSERTRGQRARLVGRGLRPVPGDRRRSEGAGRRSQFAASIAGRRQADRRLVHRRHPHRPRRARPFQGDHRAVRTTAADTVYRAAGDAVRRHFPCARHCRPSDLQLFRPAARARSNPRVPAPLQTGHGGVPAGHPRRRRATRPACVRKIRQCQSRYGGSAQRPSGPSRCLRSALPRRAERPAGTTSGVGASDVHGDHGPAFPEPWIFIAMQKVPVDEGQFTFVPVPGPTLDGAQVAQMLNFRGGPQVVPVPATNNQNPITCRHAAFQKPPLPKSERKGVATADFIDGNAVGSPHPGDRRHHRRPEEESLLQYRLHQLSHRHRPAIGSLRQQLQGRRRRHGGAAERRPGTSAISAGSRRSSESDPAVPTATRRTATETAEVVEFINRELLGK